MCPSSFILSVFAHGSAVSFFREEYACVCFQSERPGSFHATPPNVPRHLFIRPSKSEIRLQRARKKHFFLYRREFASPLAIQPKAFFESSSPARLRIPTTFLPAERKKISFPFPSHLAPWRDMSPVYYVRKDAARLNGITDGFEI